MIRSSLALALVAVTALSAEAAVSFNQDVTNNVIYGGGNINGAFTVDRANNVELGLRAKERYDLANNVPQNNFGSNGNGTYNQNAGKPAGFASSRARWNFDWSVNSDMSGSSGIVLNALTYKLSLDFDPGVGTHFQSFDPLHVACADHSFGNNATGPNAGVEVMCPGGDSTYATLLNTSNLAQQSSNYDFFDSASFTFDPTVDGTYTIRLQAFGAQGASLADTQIDVIVGRGAQVPEPGTLALLGISLGGLAVVRRKKQRA